MSAIGKLRQALLGCLYPRATLCLACGRLSRGSDLCPDCETELTRRIKGRLCPVCGHRREAARCGFCEGDAPCRMRAVWYHDRAARKLVHRLKYGAVRQAAIPLSEGLAHGARKLRLPPDTVVTWVPMPPGRLRERGIDHGRVLAEETAARLKLPCRQLMLRTADSATQRGLDREERLRNLRGAFACPEKIGGHVLVVDDVMTTSATARACAVCLLAAGAREVTVLTATQA